MIHDLSELSVNCTSGEEVSSYIVTLTRKTMFTPPLG
jgi:hypothetical protein